MQGCRCVAVEQAAAELARAEAARLAGDTARAEAMLGRTERRLTRALCRSPARAELYFLRGRARHLLGKLAQAALDYAIALARGYPDPVGLLVERALLQLESGDDRGAQRDLDDALGRAPDDGRAYRARSLWSFLRGDFEQAVADATRAIALAPERSAGYFDRSAYLMALDREDEALLDLSRAMELDPEIPADRAVCC